MYPENGIYAIIPIEKASGYIKVNFSYGRFSLDKKFIVWDEEWDAKTLQKLKSDPDIKVLTHEEVLKEMAQPEWSSPEYLETK